MQRRERDALLLAMAGSLEFILRHLPTSTEKQRIALRKAIKGARPTREKALKRVLELSQPKGVQ